MKRFAACLHSCRHSGRFAVTARQFLTIVILAGCLSGLPDQAAGQGIANGLVKVESVLGLRIDIYTWSNADYMADYRRTWGAGALTSASAHGPYYMFGYGHAGPSWVADATSSGDSEEFTRQHVEWVADRVHPNYDLLLPVTNVSDSQASSGSITHWSASHSNSSASYTFFVSRNAGGMVGPPAFRAWLRSPAGAVKLRTVVEGNAKAEAAAKLSIVGSILDKRGENGVTELLEPITLFEGAIGPGANSWASPAIDTGYHFKLPNWVRLTGAQFELTMGLQFETFSYAEANPVPEPATLSALGVGILVIARRRLTLKK